MYSSFMDRSRGTKWFTFYTKVRPWLACLTSLVIIADFFQYIDVYMSYWWMMLYFLGAIAQIVFAIMVFVKSSGDYRAFVSFVKVALIFETIFAPYSQAVMIYIENDFDSGFAFIMYIVAFVIMFFLWYRLNMDYFRKRLLTTDSMFAGSQFVWNDIPCDGSQGTKPVFCRRCGQKLAEGAKFCVKCGARIDE